MTRYQEFPPPRGLAEIVECVWILEGDDGSLRPVFPDGAVDIVASRRGAFVHGPSASCRWISVATPILGYRLRLGAAKAVLGTSPGELQGKAIPFDELWRHDGAISEVAASLGISATESMLRTFLIARLNYAPRPDRALLAAAEHIGGHPRTTLKSLASHTGLSERHLRRRFKEDVGLGLKQYARVARFQRLLDATRGIKRRRWKFSGWAGFAVDHGFADQAHLVREVQTFAGMTPARLLAVL